MPTLGLSIMSVKADSLRAEFRVISQLLVKFGSSILSTIRFALTSKLDQVNTQRIIRRQFGSVLTI
jgi:hypothetical protein